MSSVTGFLATTLARLDPPPVAVDTSLSPAVLVHGLDGTGADMARVGRALRAKGREVLAIDLVPSDGRPPLEELSAQLNSFIDSNVPPERRPLDLIAHSMGGLVCRHYVQARGGAEHTRSLITLATPHRGTWLARMRRGEGVRQMRPGSDFLSELNSPEGHAELANISFTSLWTPTDLIILPPSSSVMPNANNAWLWSVGHFSPVLGPRFIRRILRALEEPPNHSSSTDST